jgi:hypothetical protein
MLGGTFSTPHSLAYGHHPQIIHNANCELCSLGKGDRISVGGAGPDDLSKVKLIVISDHPGYYELQAGYPLYDSTPDVKTRYQIALSKQASNREPKSLKEVYEAAIPGAVNAGGTMRKVLNEVLGLNSYTECWITNVLKCDRKDRTPGAEEINTCIDAWLRNELAWLEETQGEEEVTPTAPHAPILLAGKIAYAGFRLLDPEVAKCWPGSLNSARRRRDLRWRGRPVVCTFNPAQVASSVNRIEGAVAWSETQRPIVTRCKRWAVPIPGSPMDVFCRDIQILKDFL